MKCSWCKSKFLPKKGYAVSGAAARNVRISEAGGMDAILKKSQQQDMALEQISVSNRRNKPPSTILNSSPKKPKKSTLSPPYTGKPKKGTLSPPYTGKPKKGTLSRLQWS